jgi:prophage DNA circulation protein
VGIFENYPAAAWKVGDDPAIYFPIEGQLQEKGGNRIVRHKRPYRKGAKLDSTGQNEREWTFTATFNNTIVETGIDNARELYPFVLRDLVASFALQETGTLTLPTIGDVRARAETYVRVEDAAERQEAKLQLTFVEDNEEAASTVSLQTASVRSTVEALADQTTFSAQSVAALDRDLVQAKKKSVTIAQLLTAPGRALSDLQSIVTDARRSLLRIQSTQESFARATHASHDEPRGSEFWRDLTRLLDLQAKSTDEKFASRPRVRAFVVDVERTSIFEVAARLKQDASELLDLNSERVSDPFDLERGDVIRVFERPPA